MRRAEKIYAGDGDKGGKGDDAPCSSPYSATRAHLGASSGIADELRDPCAAPDPAPLQNVTRLLNEAAIHFESFPGGRDGNGMALLYRAIEQLKPRKGRKFKT